MLCRPVWKALPALMFLAAAASAHAAAPRVLVTISKETTYITEPLRPDGYPDYLAALNQRYSRGVTPENNAAVLFLRAEGPPSLSTKKLFELLGVAPPPDNGTSLIEVDGYAGGLAQEDLSPDFRYPAYAGAKAWEQQQMAMQRPWSRTEFPVLAGWLAANEKPMVLVAEASKRPRWYFPIVADSTEPQIGVLLRATGGEERFRLADRARGPQICVTRAFVTRAMLRLHEGKTDEAWQDLLACHRLARLLGQGSGLAFVVVANQIESLACKGDQALLRHARLAPPQILKMQADLASLPPIASMADKIDFEDRCVQLDAVVTVARRAPASIRNLLGPDDSRDKSLDRSVLIAEKTDWDTVLRMSGSWCDRILAAFQRPTHAQRAKAMAELDDELQKMAKSIRSTMPFGSSPDGNTRETVSAWMGRRFITILSPAFIPARIVEESAATQWDISNLAFALAAYRADHGSYPSKLADLVPKHVKELPRDMFHNGEFRYKRDGNGYLLYSVGPNGKDDGGKTDTDRKSNEDWDDI
jgi:hypothetical protein